MKRLSHLALLAALLFPVAALADMGPSYPDIGGITPPGSTSLEETPISLDKEIVTFSVPKTPGGYGSMPATATFWLRNQTSKDVSIKSTFPLYLPDGTQYANNVSVTIDGKSASGTVEKTSYPAIDSANKLTLTSTQGFIFPLTVGAGKTTKVVISFLSPYKSESDNVSIGFNYLLSSGAGWAGMIGNAKIELDYPYPLQKGWLGDVTSTANANSVTLEFTNFKPTLANDLGFEILNPSIAKKIIDAQAAVNKSPNATNYQKLADAYSGIIFYRGTRPSFAIQGYREAMDHALLSQYGTLTEPQTATAAMVLANYYSENFSDPCEGAGCPESLVNDQALTQLISYIRTHAWPTSETTGIAELNAKIAALESTYKNAGYAGFSLAPTSTPPTPTAAEAPPTPTVQSPPPGSVALPMSARPQPPYTTYTILGVIAAAFVLALGFLMGKGKKK